MNLPIDVIPNTTSRRFRWQQTVSTPVGDRVVCYDGSLPPSVEGAVLQLISLAKRQEQEITALRDQLRATDCAEEAVELAARGVKRISSLKRGKG